MTNPKALITEYLRALSGQPKTTPIVRKYVSDERLVQHIADVEAGFPKYEIVAEDMLVDGNKVVVLGEFRGTHRGPFAGVEPTGKSVTAGLIIIYQIADDRIVDHWMQFDLFTLMHQLQTSPAVQTA